MVFTPTPDAKAQVWDSLGTGLRNGSKYNHTYNGKLIVGIRDTVGSLYLPNVGVWDGTSWDTLGGGIDGALYSTTEFNGNLYIGGDFIYCGDFHFPGPRADNLTYWDGSNYHLTDYHNFGAWVNALATYNNELYLGASTQFNVNGIIYNAIARFDGTNWNDVDGGVLSSFKQVLCMTEFNGDLIVGGFFLQAGAIPTNNIARWNGIQWDSIGTGLDYVVRALVVDTINNELYAGGSFYFAGNTPVNFVARWDGFNWQPLGNGLTGPVNALSIYKGMLYAGTTANSNPSSLMRFDGSNWVPVVPSPNKLVYCLTIYQGDLYVSGNFDNIGGVPYGGIARYTDTTTVGLSHEVLSAKGCFTIYPNPTQGNLQLIFTKPINEKSEVEIYNSKGELIFQKSFERINETLKIQLPVSMGSGVYVCKVVNKTFQQQRSFVLQ